MRRIPDPAAGYPGIRYALIHSFSHALMRQLSMEAGYTALIARSTTVRRGDIEIPVGSLADLIRSKELLRRAKDVEHLAALYDHFPQLAAGSERPPPAPE